MKIAVLSGSPKGPTSVTLQYIHFLQKKLPQHEFNILPVASELRRLEDDSQAWTALLDGIASADAVWWAFPLYVLAVHGHYKRFIELISERKCEAVFRGKYAAVFTTSIRFYDHTAHAYLHGICDDLQMKYWGGYSAEMYDLLKPAERQRWLRFAEDFLAAAKEDVPTPRCHAPLRTSDFRYVAGNATGRVLTAASPRILVLTDDGSDEPNLQNMVTRFCGTFAQAPEVIRLRDVNMRGGCLGCIQCALDNVCVYRDADEVRQVYQRLLEADVLVLAGTIRDRYLSARWKMFIDRGFFHNHVPMFVGKQLGWLISGPLQQLPNLREMLDAYTELQGANLAGIVTDEGGDSAELDQLLEALAARLVTCAANGYIGPPTFRGVAGRKLFRDEIWSSLRMVFHADHRYYKQHGLYDFPRRGLKMRLTNLLVAWLTKIPSFRREFLKRIKAEMVKPLEKALEKL